MLKWKKIIKITKLYDKEEMQLILSKVSYTPLLNEQ